MRVYLVMIGAGLLWACTASKFKTKYASREVLSVRSDSTVNESGWKRLIAVDSSAYDAVWWLKGNTHWHPDSGMTADELIIRYQGKEWRQAEVFDSLHRFYEGRDVARQENDILLKEKYREQKDLLDLPWWAYLVLVCLLYFFCLKRS